MHIALAGSNSAARSHHVVPEVRRDRLAGHVTRAAGSHHSLLLHEVHVVVAVTSVETLLLLLLLVVHLLLLLLLIVFVEASSETTLLRSSLSVVEELAPVATREAHATLIVVVVAHGKVGSALLLTSRPVEAFLATATARHVVLIRHVHAVVPAEVVHVAHARLVESVEVLVAHHTAAGSLLAPKSGVLR